MTITIPNLEEGDFVQCYSKQLDTMGMSFRVRVIAKVLEKHQGAYLVESLHSNRAYLHPGTKFLISIIPSTTTLCRDVKKITEEEAIAQAL